MRRRRRRDVSDGLVDHKVAGDKSIITEDSDHLQFTPKGLNFANGSAKGSSRSGSSLPEAAK